MINEVSDRVPLLAMQSSALVFCLNLRMIKVITAHSLVLL